MKPLFEQIEPSPNQSFTCRDIIVPSRSDLKSTWHFHPELEVTFTLKSRGRRFVGTSIEDYDVNDLVILGSNTPHSWLTDEASHQIVLQFKPLFLGENYASLPEMQKLVHLFEESQRGIRFSPSFSQQLKPLFLQIRKAEGLKKLTLLLEILEQLADTSEWQYIQAIHFQLADNHKDLANIQKVYDYIVKHYQTDELNLSNMATSLHMSKPAFCRFIKQKTNKTFSQLVNEFRISQACRMLVQEEARSISEIGFAIGYKDISYFNRIFKTIKNKSPKTYRSEKGS